MLIAALLGALFLLPAAGLAALIAVLVAAGAYEWARLCRLGRGAWLYAAALAAGFVALRLGGEALALPLFAVAAAFWLLAVPVWLWHGVRSSQRAALGAAGVLVLLPAALALAALAPAPALIALGLVWIADTAAYFAGRRFGRHKLAPTVSPGKTWEGAAAGLLGAAAYAIICVILVEGLAWLPTLAAAVLVAAVSIVGDLFESAAKRQASVKNSGTLLPGHGGILDRIDSATAALPLGALLAYWLLAP